MTGSLITIHSEISPYLLKNSRRLSENTKVNSVNGLVLEMKGWLVVAGWCVCVCDGSVAHFPISDSQTWHYVAKPAILELESMPVSPSAREPADTNYCSRYEQRRIEGGQQQLRYIYYCLHLTVQEEKTNRTFNVMITNLVKSANWVLQRTFCWNKKIYP